jgi:hypothetical protein
MPTGDAARLISAIERAISSISRWWSVCAVGLTDVSRYARSRTFNSSDEAACGLPIVRSYVRKNLIDILPTAPRPWCQGRRASLFLGQGIGCGVFRSFCFALKNSEVECLVTDRVEKGNEFAVSPERTRFRSPRNLINGAPGPVLLSGDGRWPSRLCPADDHAELDLANGIFERMTLTLEVFF